MCCKSKGLTMLSCNVTKNYTDRDTSLVINRPRYRWDAFKEPKVIDGEIIRDIDQWWINGLVYSTYAFLLLGCFTITILLLIFLLPLLLFFCIQFHSQESTKACYKSVGLGFTFLSSNY